MTIHLKACPRCRGDMAENSDRYGGYDECLQCGHMTDSGNPTEKANKKDGWPMKKNRPKR